MKKLLKLIPALVLVTGLLFLTGCDENGNGDGDGPDTSVLETLISQAELLLETTAKSTDGTDIAIGKWWVTPTVWENFEDNIDTSRAILSSAQTQQEVNSEVIFLTNKIADFTNARERGSITTGLDADDIAEFAADIEATKALIKISTDGKDISPSEFWVTQEVMDALNEAINIAIAATDNFDDAYMALYQAFGDFEEAISAGLKAATITINGLPDEVELIAAFLSLSSNDYLNAQPFVGSEGIVENNTAILELYSMHNGDLWSASGTWYIWIVTGDEEEELIAHGISKIMYNFGTNPNPVLNYSDFNMTNFAENAATVTVNGLDFEDDTYAQLGLFANMTAMMNYIEAMFSEEDGFRVGVTGGYGYIEDGSITIELETGLGIPWNDGGSWYVCLMIDDGGMPLFLVTKQTVDFTANSDPELEMSDFSYGSFWGLFAFLSTEVDPDDGTEIDGGNAFDIHFETTGSKTMTLNQYAGYITGGAMNYAQLTSGGDDRDPWVIYKDPALTSPAFTGTDVVGFFTLMFSNEPMYASDDGDSGGDWELPHQRIVVENLDFGFHGGDVYVMLGLFGDMGEIEAYLENPDLDIIGNQGNIQDGTLDFLINDAKGNAWTGSGNYYVGLVITYEMMAGEFDTVFYVSKEAINFKPTSSGGPGPSPNPTTMLNIDNDFTPGFYFGMEFAELFAGGVTMTLDEWAVAFSEGGFADYDALVEAYGEAAMLFKDSAMTIPFVGTDTIGFFTIAFAEGMEDEPIDP
ncbi:MAG: hypothetical protein FWD26_08685 [Treponema sp.]|nr:hypothetical protein [Treponema sp.]